MTFDSLDICKDWATTKTKMRFNSSESVDSNWRGMEGVNG